MVSSGSQVSNCLNDFSPAGTSNQAICFFPPYAFFTAASSTRTLARQMSGPVPSPSIKGIMGSSGTASRPFLRVIAVPLVGGLRIVKVGISSFRSHHRRAVRRSSQKLWKRLWKSDAVTHVAPRQSAVSSGLHHDGARTDAIACAFESTKHDIILTD